MKPKKVISSRGEIGVGGGSRGVSGITGKGGKFVTKEFKETGNSVKVIVPGTKPLTKPNVPYSAFVPRSPDQLKRMGL